jgi:hypothetical protein
LVFGLGFGRAVAKIEILYIVTVIKMNLRLADSSEIGLRAVESKLKLLEESAQAAKR